MKRHLSPRRQRRRAGFTLLEVLIVLAIIGVIAAMAVPQLLRQGQEANRKQTRAAIANLEQAAQLYAVDNNFEPPTGSEDAIQMMMTANQSTGKPAVLDREPLDAWGNRLNYEYPNRHLQESQTPAIWSNGPDGREGTEDDINNWDEVLNRK